jgi:hypothetical protein
MEIALNWGGSIDIEQIILIFLNWSLNTLLNLSGEYFRFVKTDHWILFIEHFV